MLWQVTHALASAVLLGGKRRHGGEEVRAQLVVAFEALCRDGYLELVPHQAQLAAPGAVAASSSVEVIAELPPHGVLGRALPLVTHV